MWLVKVVPRRISRSCAGSENPAGSSPGRKKRSWSVRMNRMFGPRGGAPPEVPAVAAIASGEIARPAAAVVRNSRRDQSAAALSSGYEFK